MFRALNQNFFKKWSYDMAYVLGYFAADGSMIKNKRGGHYIEITTTDFVLLKHLRTITESTNRICIRKKNNKKWKTQYRIQIASHTWFEDLSRLGLTQSKSKTLCFPKIPEAFLGDFVRGYFDGDGCVYLGHLKYSDRTYKRWVLQTLFTSGSQLFLLQLWEVLKNNGIRGGSLVSKRRGYELKFSHRDSVELYWFMYHNARTQEISLPRKRKKLEKAIKIIGRMRE